VFRTHCEAECSCQPWDYMSDDVYEAAITAAFQLRNELMPYIYTAAYEAYRTGITINRGIYFDAADYPQAYSEEHRQTYLFGSSMLVAAIAEPGTSLDGSNTSATLRTHRAIWLPPGEWHSWLQRVASTFHGPADMARGFALDELPVFVKAGAMVPMKANQSFHATPVADPLVWNVFPVPTVGVDKGQGIGAVYEDAGDGLGYQQHEHQIFNATQTMTAQRKEDGVDVNVLQAVVQAMPGGSSVDFAPELRTQQLQILSQHSRTVTSVSCNEQHLKPTVAVPYSATGSGFWKAKVGAWHALVVRCPAFAYAASLCVTVEFA
jgi:alpha-glucosidase (family GH31 glycosyl hydrolase)